MHQYARLLAAALLAAPGFLAHAQSVGIGTTAPDASAALEVRSSTQGVLVPRLSETQRQGIDRPATGLLVFQTDGAQPGFWYFVGPGGWTFLNPFGGGADNLGNHMATQALNLQANALVGTGASVGTAVGLGVRADGGLNLGQNTDGNNLFLGYQAGPSTTFIPAGPRSGARGNKNQFVGFQSGYSNTTGYNNVFSGYQSGYFNTTGHNNLFSGYRSGYSNTTGSGNLFGGYLSGYFNTTGNNNLFSGIESGEANTTGYGNQFEGYQSGISNTTGIVNLFSGYQSGFYNTTGSNNQFEGYQSGISNTAGNENVYVGYQSGGNSSSSSGNTAIGAYSGIYPNYPDVPDAVTNSTALGYGTILSTSNTVKLGNDDTRLLSCAVGLSVYSDARLKTDVQADVPGLAFITQLRPVTYRFDAARLAALTQAPSPARPRQAAPPDPTRHTGFLAQEVETAARRVGFDFDGLHRPANARDPYALGYAQFVVPLVRAVQEQQTQLDTLQAQNAALQTRTAQAEADHAALRTLQAQVARLLAGATPAETPALAR